ncbi:hypothetical protein EU537_06235 [Candidatus Thorarchaeota archaeon]|nr:MAG: hypothetical protein EU537_06235 [Candidatus Thorarchaeota archaeon]
MNILFDDRAMLISSEEATALVIADIHLGYEVALSEKTNVSFPPQNAAMIERIEKLVYAYDVTDLYLLGDIKHTISPDKHYNWSIIPQFIARLAQLASLTIVPGNHDGDLKNLLPRGVESSSIRGVIHETSEEQIALLHGHAWPASDLLNCKLMLVGHNHPSIKRIKVVSTPNLGRRDKLRSAKSIPVFVKSKLDRECVRRNAGLPKSDKKGFQTMVTLPSFNELVIGIQINRPDARFLGPIFENNCSNLLSATAYSNNGINLGSVEHLQTRLSEAFL